VIFEAVEGADELETNMPTTRLLVSVVDDDESVRESLPDLLYAMGFEVRAFASAEEFLVSDALHQSACLILDVAMPGMSGPELQEELKRLNVGLPVIFITAQPNDVVRGLVKQYRAARFLLKPFGDLELEDALNSALGRK
jgi:FixJ family two-component response regulator